MAKQEPDADEQPIHFTEIYRRAKRNVLFWAAATILIALGTAASTGGVQVENMVKGLSLPPGLLTVFSLCVLGFMFAGYYRAERALLARHTGFALAARIADQAEVVEQLACDLRNLENAINQADSAVRGRDTEYADFLERIEKGLGQVSGAYNASSLWNPAKTIDVVPQTRAMRDAAVALHMAMNGDPKLESQAQDQYERRVGSVIETVRGKVIEAAKTILLAKLKGLDQITSGAVADLAEVRKATSAVETSSRSDLTEKHEALVALGGQLRRFANSIGFGERAWFYAHDRTPVLSLCALASVAALWRLGDPVSLASNLEYWFPHRQSPGIQLSVPSFSPNHSWAGFPGQYT